MEMKVSARSSGRTSWLSGSRFLRHPARWRATRPGFDDLLASRARRRALRDYVTALLQPRDRNKTLTAPAEAEAVVGATHREVQRLQWFLSESPWEHEPINDRRIELLIQAAATAPHGQGALLLDDSGNRKSGHATAYVSRQYIGSRAQIENGIVAVSTAWADERIYYPLHTAPYQSAPTLPEGRADAAFRTKGRLAADLVARARTAGIPFRALVADCFYGPSESPRFIADLDAAGVPYVVAIKPNTPIMTSSGHTLTPARRVVRAGWLSRSHPGRWRPVRRRYRDGHAETWWAIELTMARYGPDRPHRMIVATSDPARGRPHWPKSFTCTGCAAGSSRTANRPSTSWAGPTFRSAPAGPSSATGPWSTWPSASAGCTPPTIPAGTPPRPRTPRRPATRFRHPRPRALPARRPGPNASAGSAPA
ncbi:hypothetical protein GCM10023075_37260 [Streptosporangium album]